MNKLFKTAAIAVFTAVTISSFSSCSKEEDEGLLPNISFKSGTDYTSADANVGQGKAVKIGITASKSEDKDVLTKFTITQSLDGATETTVFTKDLTGTEGDAYSYDYATTTRNKAGTEKYTFTVVNRDGLINKTSLVLTVQ